MATIHLVLGGARSGKSRYAEMLASELHKKSPVSNRLIYLATATAGDQEMAARIKQHQSDRQRDQHTPWQLIEEPIEITKVIKTAQPDSTILVDCLTLWLSNCLHQQCWGEQREQLFSALDTCHANIVMVSNEVGSGIVPMGELSREFVDQSGWLHQQLAALSTDVTLVVAGLPISVKSSKTTI